MQNAPAYPSLIEQANLVSAMLGDFHSQIRIQELHSDPKIEGASESMSSKKVFVTATWRDLAMLNFEVEPLLLAEFIPPGTELDDWNGKTFVSLVGFRFLKTEVCGFSIPFHRDFDEVNLRFYVRRTEGAEVKRGVAFIREIVPRWSTATVARKIYNERYVALPMTHRKESREQSGLFVEYCWQSSTGWSRMSLSTQGDPALPDPGSHEQFITEHYWGYALQRNGGTIEYRVEHPSWRVWQGRAKFEGDTSELYGPEFSMLLQTEPTSAILAEGSEITVYRGRKL